MNFKVHFVIFIVAVASVQVSCKTIKVSDDEDNDNALTKNVSDMLVQITDLVSTILKDVSKSIGRAQIKTDDVQDGLAAIATDISERILYVVVNQLDAIADNTNDTGKQIIKCLDKEILTFRTLLSNTITDIVTCSSEELPDLFGDVKILVDNVEISVDEFKSLGVDLGECSSGISSCGMDFLEKSYILGQNLLNNLNADGISVLEALQKIGASIDPCITSNLEIMQDTNSDLFNRVIKCIKN